MPLPLPIVPQALRLATANNAMITTMILLIKKSSLLRPARLMVGDESESSDDLYDRLVQKEHRSNGLSAPHFARKARSNEQYSRARARAGIEIDDI